MTDLKTHPNYIYRLFHWPGSRARVLINGVRIYDDAPKPPTSSTSNACFAPTAPMTHWLTKGASAITIELFPALSSLLTPSGRTRFELHIANANDADNPVWKWIYPNDVAAAGLPFDLPYVHQGIMVVDADLPLPVYLNGTPEDFPVEGTPDQHAAVLELYEAFATRDAARFKAAMELRYSEFDRFYGLSPAERGNMTRSLSQPWIMAPFDADDLRFDRSAGGRVAFVHRASGIPAVYAEHRDEPALAWGNDLYMTRLDGRWRIFW